MSEFPDFTKLPRPTKTYHNKTYDRISPSKTKFEGKGKTILITGGATGVGYSISESFAEAGVERIIIISRSPSPQAEAKKALEAKFPRTKIEPFQAALTDNARIDEILKSVGPIDVLVLCAAATHQPSAASEDIPVDAFDNCFNINVLAGFNILKTYMQLPNPPLGEKTVINVSSLAAYMDFGGMAGYGPSKAAFTQVVQCFAREQNPDKGGVRMFSYHPGAFLTPMAKSVGHTEDNGLEWDDIRLPGHFAVWLASPESTFLHGRMLWSHWDVDDLIALKGKMEKEPMYLKLGLVM